MRIGEIDPSLISTVHTSANLFQLDNLQDFNMIEISDGSKPYYEQIKQTIIDSMKSIPDENRVEIMMAINNLTHGWVLAHFNKLDLQLDFEDEK